MHCAKCGNPLADDAAFCNQCGSAVQPAAPAPAENEPPPVTVLIEPGAGVWTPAPDAAAASEEVPSTMPAQPMPANTAAAAPISAPKPAFAAAYAGFWRRFVAYWLDIFIFVSLEIFIAYVRGVPLNARQELDPAELAKGFLISTFIYWLYWAILESSPWQATVGKRAMDIYVTDLQGRRISFGKASARFFGKIISALILGIGFFMIAFTDRRQGLHDQLAGCLVLRRAE